MAALWIWVIAIGLLILVLYLIGTWNHDYFSKRNVPTLKTLPLIGNMGPVVFRQLSFSDFMADIYNRLEGHKYGGVYEFLKPILVLRDPELIKLVTVKDFEYFLDHRAVMTEDTEPTFGKVLFNLQGLKWKHMRSTLSPAFTSSKMKNMFVLISECGVQLGDFLHKCINDKNMKIEDCKIEREGKKLEVETKDLFTRYTNDVIATSAFGIRCDSLKEPKNEFYTLGKRFTNMGTIQKLKFLGYSLSPNLMKILKIRLMSEKIGKFFHSLIIDTMKIRESKGIIRPDMIHLLMQARKETLQSEENDDTADTTTTKPKLDDDDIVAQAVIFFLAGFETVATLMCFASHLLAVHPDIQSRLQEEIDQTLQENDGKLTYEALHSMKYLDMVVSETLRLYPPAAFMDRKCNKTYTLPTEPPHTLNPGDSVWIPIHGHHDPQYFPDPEKFDPERFNHENKDKIKPFTYLPFGSGPRNCIGNRLALMEAKVALVHILSRFNLKVVSRTPIPLQISKSEFNLTVDGGFWLGLEERS